MKTKTVHTKEYIALIDYLIALRKESSINQHEMAEALNLKQADISKIEIKERRLDVSETFTWLQKCCPKNIEIVLEIYKIFINASENERY